MMSEQDDYGNTNANIDERLVRKGDKGQKRLVRVMTAKSHQKHDQIQDYEGEKGKERKRKRVRIRCNMHLPCPHTHPAAIAREHLFARSRSASRCASYREKSIWPSHFTSVFTSLGSWSYHITLESRKLP